MGKTTNILDLNNRIEKLENENVAQNSYTSLKNKPKINNVTLTGNKSLADIGAASDADLTTLTNLVNLKSNIILVENKDITIGSITAGSYKDFTVSVAKTGYTPIGIVGLRVGGAPAIGINNFYLDSSDVKIRLNNNTSSDITLNASYVTVLYVQNDPT